MIIVQKVTTVAFGVHDGLYRTKRKDFNLNEDQKFHSITSIPTMLEYAAYIFNFQTVICGPLVCYIDWTEFVNGEKLRKAGLKQYPSSKLVVLSKLAITAVCGFLIVTFTPLYPGTLLTGKFNLTFCLFL